MSSRTDSRVAQMYTESVAAITAHLVREGGLARCANCTYIGRWNFRTKRYEDKMDHLVCFVPGMLALGAHSGIHGVRGGAAARATMALAERVRSVARDLGDELEFVSTGGACDGNDLQAAGLPTIDTLGVRGGGMHRPDEHIQLSSLVERATLVAILLHRLDRDGFGERSPSGRPIP